MVEGRGRPRTPIGGIGKVDYEKTANGVTAAAYTRVASGARRRIQETAPTNDLALEALRAKAARLGLVVASSANVTTTRALLDTWVEEVVEPRNIKAQTKRMYRTKVARLADICGGIALEELRPTRVQGIVNELASKVTPAEFTVLRGVLNRALSYGVMMEVLTANHLIVTENPPLLPKGDPVSLTAAQLAQFRRSFAAYVAEGVRDSNRRRSQLLVDIILGLGGLRIAEALAVRHVDTDFRTRVDINGTVVYKPGSPVFRQGELKRERQKRGLVVNAGGMGMLALIAARDEAPLYRRAPLDPVIGRVEPDQGVWMNPSIPSFHIDAVTWRAEMAESLAETGLTPEHVTPHTLRRTVATLVARGEGEERAKEMLAHDDVRTTRGSYITPEGNEVKLETLDALLEE